MMKLLKTLVAFFYVKSDIWIKGVLYMRRWRFFPDWLPGARVHNILQSDDDRALHDHPFSFLTIILRGGYYEYLADGSKTWHGPGSILWRPAVTAHRVELKTLCDPERAGGPCDPDVCALQPAWTFVFRSRYFREWGFHTKAGWVHNRQFVQKREGNHIDQGGQQ